MRVRLAFFYHSLVSDWNHGNAHFLRGVVSELLIRGHEVVVHEPESAWSVENLVKDHGFRAIDAFHEFYPHLLSRRYAGDGAGLDLDELLAGIDLVLVHEWNERGLVKKLGEHRKRNSSYRLLFHDTHHRMVTDPEAMRAFDLSGYDGVLAFGEVISRMYRERGIAERAWTWHEAADTRVFRPMEAQPDGDVIWVGNWGDEERSRELQEFLIDPVAELGLKTRVHGVRYPEHAKERLRAAGIEYRGWIPNFAVPREFSRHRLTVHVPRGPYVTALPGIPTIRVFEALACGIPLICSPWQDAEHLFRPGTDYLVATTGQQMRELMGQLISDRACAREVANRGLETIRARHTCAHRVDELLAIRDELLGKRGAA